MNLTEIKQLAKERGIVLSKLRKSELILSLQAQEGNLPCYSTSYAQECEQPNCLWRPDRQ